MQTISALTEKVDNLLVEDFETTTLAEQHGEQIKIDHGKGKNVAEDQEDATEDEFYDSHEYTTEELEVSIGLHHVGTTALDVTLTVACMSSQKRMIQEANECKVAGNEFFAKAQYDEAIAKYEDALMACPERSTQERAIYFANIAACQMKQVHFAFQILLLLEFRIDLIVNFRTSMPKPEIHAQKQLNYTPNIANHYFDGHKQKKRLEHTLH